MMVGQEGDLLLPQGREKVFFTAVVSCPKWHSDPKETSLKSIELKTVDETEVEREEWGITVKRPEDPLFHRKEQLGLNDWQWGMPALTDQCSNEKLSVRNTSAGCPKTSPCPGPAAKNEAGQAR